MYIQYVKLHRHLYRCKLNYEKSKSGEIQQKYVFLKYNYEKKFVRKYWIRWKFNSGMVTFRMNKVTLQKRSSARALYRVRIERFD